MTQPAPITLRCPAKLNLALSVAAPDPQHGRRHPIASWMVATVFGDTLTLEKTDGDATFHRQCLPIHDEDDHDPDADSNDAAQGTSPDDARSAREPDWPLESDLIHKAWRAVCQHVGKDLPIHATLRKRIPPGGGLGGGSCNAAAMLIALDQLFNLELREDLITLAQNLGSDVPFLVHAIQGQTSMLVTGLGETLEPLPLAMMLPIVLAFPPVACPTAEVYKAFDLQCPDAPAKPDRDRILELHRHTPLPQNGPFNDLAQPAMTVQPILRKHLETLHENHIEAHITGSGSTLFVLAPSALSSKALARGIHQLTNLPTLATRTL